MGGSQDQDHSEEGLGVNVNGESIPVASRTFPVTASRVPVHKLLVSEHENALREEVDRVKVSFFFVG